MQRFLKSPFFIIIGPICQACVKTTSFLRINLFWIVCIPHQRRMPHSICVLTIGFGPTTRVANNNWSLPNWQPLMDTSLLICIFGLKLKRGTQGANSRKTKLAIGHCSVLRIYSAFWSLFKLFLCKQIGEAIEWRLIALCKRSFCLTDQAWKNHRQRPWGRKSFCWRISSCPRIMLFMSLFKRQTREIDVFNGPVWLSQSFGFWRLFACNSTRVIAQFYLFCKHDRHFARVIN